MAQQIDLKRTFRTLSDADEGDAEFSKAWYGLVGEGQSWDSLLEQRRTVILAEAGAGKTYEMRSVTRRLRDEGKAAFFFEIADLAEMPLDEILSSDDDVRFQAWLESVEDGWFLLDSVDEARLRDYRSFQNALRSLGRALKTDLDRTHIFISCRGSDWEANFDRDLVVTLLPLSNQETASGESEARDGLEALPPKDGKSPENPIHVVKLQELSKEQMRQFVQAQGGIDANAFMAAVEHADVFQFAARPLDLAEMLEYWREHGTVGTHAEMIQFNIEKKLAEYKRERKRVQPLSAKKCLQGATLLAAGLTFVKATSILLPDSSPAPEHQHNAIRAEDILTDWAEPEISALLSRPIFDEATYGRVRFHHRSVREYLNARWLNALLRQGRNRRSVEVLLFASRYGHDMVVPYMQPVAAWLAIWDEPVRSRILAVAPEVLVDYGDPSRFPVEFREQMLRNMVALHDKPESRQSFDISAVRRFASPDIAPVLNELLEAQPDNADMSQLFLRVIWQGKLSDCAEIALSYALNEATSSNTRYYAVLAVSAAGNQEQKTRLVSAFMSSLSAWDKNVAGAFVEGFFPEMLSVEKFFTILKAFPDEDEFDSSRLTYFLEQLPFVPLSMEEYLKILDLVCLQLDGFRLKDHGYSVTANEIHLMKAAMKILAYLMELSFFNDRDGYPESVYTLIAYAAVFDSHHGRPVSDGAVLRFIQQNPGLRRELFWREVRRARASLSKKGNHLRHFYNTDFEYEFCPLPYEDFQYFLEEIDNRGLADDRHVAFTAAHVIWRKISSDKEDLQRLREAVVSHTEMAEELSKEIDVMGPSCPSRSILEHEARAEAGRMKRARQEEEKKRKWEQWEEALQKSPGRLRDVTAESFADRTSDFLALIGKLGGREELRRTIGVYANWKRLEPVFGIEVAQACRDGLYKYWRLYSPATDSESLDSKYPWELSVGLTGLAIESNESPNWAQGLTAAEASVASRYAACEMNEFPAWILGVVQHHVAEFSSVMREEINWELQRPNGENVFPKNLSKLAYGHDEIASACHATLFELLEEADAVNEKALDRALRTFLGKGCIDVARLGALAQKRFVEAESGMKRSLWLLAWLCVEGDGAVRALEHWLDEISSPKEADDLVTNLAAALFGDFHGVCYKSKYQDFLRGGPLVRLVEIAFRYIRVEEDQRHTGSFTPNTRDGAQRARDRLVEKLASNPSRSSHAALVDLAFYFDYEWMGYLALACAARAAEFQPWKASDVVEFANIGTATPRNDRALFDLVLLRLDDLKYDLEQGDASVAAILQKVAPETHYRVWFTRELRLASHSQYTVAPEEEMVDGKRPDIRIHATTVDSQVPIELKIADKWTLAELKERIHNQLVGQYLRAEGTKYGVFLLVYQGTKKYWADRSTGQRACSLDELCAILQQEADNPQKEDVEVEDIRVVGIDLTKRCDHAA